MNFLHDGNLKDGCIVSIGSGLTLGTAPPVRFSKHSRWSLLKAWHALARQIVTETESTHKEVSMALERSQTPYFRFNLDEIGDVRLDEWKKSEYIAASTMTHLKSQKTSNMLDKCAEVLVRNIRIRQSDTVEDWPNFSSTNRILAISPKYVADTQSYNPENYRIGLDLRGVPVIDHFVDRPREMAKLEQLLVSNHSHRRKTCVLVGLGGIGKTQLSVEFARRQRERFSAIFWLCASSRHTLTRGFADAASTIFSTQRRCTSGSHKQQVKDDLDLHIQDVISWLSIPENDSWLLVYDDLEDGDLIRDFLPGADHGSILITTRRLDIRLGTQIFLGGLDENQAIALLSCSHSTNEHKSHTNLESRDGRELAQFLGGFPLALAQASRYIQETNISISEFIQLYEEHRLKLMNVPQRSADPQRSLMTTWKSSLDVIHEINEDSVRLLELLACLDNKDIRFELFHAAFVKLSSSDEDTPTWFQRLASDKLSFLTTIRPLLIYSLLEGSAASSYTIHVLVQEWSWQMHTIHSRGKLVALAVLIVGSAVPANSQRDFWITQRRLLPHADRCVKKFSEFIGKGQAQLTNLGLNYPTPLFLEALSNLGSLYKDQTEFAKAEELLCLALEQKERLLGSEHLSTLDTMQDLGNLYCAQGKYYEARELYMKVLAVRRLLLGEDHPSVLDANRLLAFSLHCQGRLMESAELNQKILHDCETILGLDHPVTLSTANNRGHVLLDQGKMVEAESMYERVLMGYTKALGDDQPSTLEIVGNLGQVYQQQGMLERAKSMYQQALMGYENSLGRLHPSTWKVMTNLSHLLKDMDDLEQAESMYVHTLETFQTRFGPVHASTLQIAVDIAQLDEYLHGRKEVVSSASGK